MQKWGKVYDEQLWRQINQTANGLLSALMAGFLWIS